MTTTHGVTASIRRPAWTFTRHYLEMVLAMLLGMATLFPLWALATSGASDAGWLHRTDVESLVMATTMSVPMAAWMAYRGHRWWLTLEMCAAMYAGFVLLFPLLWTGALDEMGVMMAGHTLMPLFMLAAMLLRRREYLTHC
jgi:hypothetical protein